MEKAITKNSKSSSIVVGLDIGTTKICVIIGRRNEQGKIEVLGLGKAPSDGVTRGVVSNIAKTVKGILQAVEEGSNQSNVDVKIVNVGIAGQHIKSLQHRGILTRKDLSNEIAKKDIDRLVDVAPEVISHNMETVKRLTREVRIQAKYERSLEVLRYLKEAGQRRTKTGVMLGLGETKDEVFQTIEDIRNANVDIITLGQYLQTTKKHLPVKKFITPEEFDEFGDYR